MKNQESVDSFIASIPLQSITREHILKQSMFSPVLHQVLSFWRAGELTWEKAMMASVLYLLIQINGYEKEAFQRCLQKFPIVKSKEAEDKGDK